MGRYLSANLEVSVKFFNRARDMFPAISQEGFSSVDFCSEAVIFNKEQTDSLCEYVNEILESAYSMNSVVADAVILIRHIGDSTLSYEVDNDPDMTGDIDWSKYELVFC